MLEDSETLYLPAPPQIEKLHAYKLDKTLRQLQEEGIIQDKQSFRWDIVDKNVKGRLMLLITLE